jgi:hypothetical protein
MINRHSLADATLPDLGGYRIDIKLSGGEE